MSTGIAISPAREPSTNWRWFALGFIALAQLMIAPARRRRRARGLGAWLRRRHGWGYVPALTAAVTAFVFVDLSKPAATAPHKSDQ